MNAPEFVSISADGRYVVFLSQATNLVAGDTNGYPDIFVHDRQTGTTTLISQSTAGVQGNGYSLDAFISPDGRYVGFYSDATNLVANDLNGRRDIFVRDRLTGTTGSLTVLESAPVANFTGTPTSGPAPLTVQFNDTSTGSPTYWTWDFGDSTNSTEKDPSHTYTAAGNYSVSLTAANAGGSDTMVKGGLWCSWLSLTDL